MKIIIVLLSGLLLNTTPGLTNQDMIVIQTIMGEGANQPLEGQIAIGEVIRNRAKRWGLTHRQTVLKPKHFSFWNQKDNAHAWLGKYGDGKTFQRASRAWHESENSNLTSGADHYCRFDSKPWWASSMQKTVRIGDHQFYREVRS